MRNSMNAKGGCELFDDDAFGGWRKDEREEKSGATNKSTRRTSIPGLSIDGIGLVMGGVRCEDLVQRARRTE